MGLARDLVELEKMLRSNGDVDVFGPLGGSGLLVSPEVNARVGRMQRIDLDGPAQVVRLCLQLFECSTRFGASVS